MTENEKLHLLEKRVTDDEKLHLLEKYVTNEAAKKAQQFRIEQTGNANYGKIISDAKRIIFDDHQAEDLNFESGQKIAKLQLMIEAVKYLIEDVMGLTPEEYDAIYSTALNQKTTLHHAIRKIANAASPTILREAMFDNKKILFRLCWPEYYKEHYAIPKAMDIFNCTGELKGNLVRASAIKDFEDEPEQEKKILQNGKFSTAKKERKRVYNHGQEVDDIIYWSMKQILPLFEMKTKDLYLSLAKPREAGWSKYGFVKVIEARGCYPTPLDFYFLNSPMEYQVDHIDEYIEARNQAKLPHVKALDMMYEAYQQSLEHGRY